MSSSKTPRVALKLETLEKLERLLEDGETEDALTLVRAVLNLEFRRALQQEIHKLRYAKYWAEKDEDEERIEKIDAKLERAYQLYF